LLRKTKALRWRKLGSPVRRREFIVLEGLGTSEAVGAFSNDITNYLLAILGRVLFRKRNGRYYSLGELLPTPGAFYHNLNSFILKLGPLLPKTAPIPRENFSGLYRGRKRRVYEQAFKLFMERGFITRDTYISMFLKYEKDIRALKPERIPRVISPAGFVYLQETGRYIKAVEHKIFDAINRVYGYQVVAKGINFQQLGVLVNEAWDSFQSPASIDLDVEKLDQSCCQEALSWTHYVVGLCFAGDDKVEIMNLLTHQLTSRVKGRADNGWFSYKVKGTLTSGQMNTSLVGVLLVTGILYKMSLQHRFKLVNCGDDCALIGNKKDMWGLGKKLKERFLVFGMTIEVSEVNLVLERIKFCQTQTLKFNSGPRAVRCLHGALSKDAACIDHLNAAHRIAAWCRSVALGGLATHGGVPVLQNFYQMYLRSFDHFVATHDLTKRQLKRMRTYLNDANSWTNYGTPMRESFREVDEITRLSFEEAFGIPPAEQMLLEEYYDSMTYNFTAPTWREPLPNHLSLFIKS